MNVAFFGLGKMGAPMAANLAREGQQVRGYDLAEVSLDGIAMAGSAAEAASGADVVITMLPGGAALRDVYNEIVAPVPPSTLFIDCSTVVIRSARAAAELMAAAGHLAVDAPVSGGMGGATAGTLTFMVGGTGDAFARAQPFFEIMGSKAVHCGESGAGQAAKICNNMILGITMIGTCEALVLADKLGLDRQTLFDVVSTSSGNSWSMSTYCPAEGVGPDSPADHDYTPGFAAELMLKDLVLGQEAARSADAATPLGSQATEIYRQFVESGGSGRDFSAILLELETSGHSE